MLFSSLTWAESSQDSLFVGGYYRKNGTFVKGYHKSKPDSHSHNNWNFLGNDNPYTGKKGRLSKKSKK